MRFTTIFFDLDDTLYPSNAGLWQAIKNRMNDYMRERMNIPANEIPALREKYYLQYGTTLHGLQKHHQIDVDDYLAYVHDLPLGDYLTPDSAQRSVIASLPTRNWSLQMQTPPLKSPRRVDLRDLASIIVDVNTVAVLQANLDHLPLP
jgi:putative hydrolase of the HAD superfamily